MGSGQAVVIGAGAGGLACALDLAAQGAAVTVVEAAPGPGGKIRRERAGGAEIDAGPTVFTMRWVFEALFAAAGARLEERLSLTPLEILARHAWSRGERLDLHADSERSEAAVGAFAGAGEARAFRAFLAEAKGVFETLNHSFLERERCGPVGLSLRVGLGRLPELFALRPFDTLAGRLEARFEDPRLRQLFGRYATYCGSSPYAAPATLMLIAHVEQAGVFAVEGGMGRLAEVLAELAAERGAQFRFGRRARRLRLSRGRVEGIELDDGEVLEADQVVFNGDPAALGEGLLGEAARPLAAARPFRARSLSAVTLCGTVRASGFPLERHNVFFSSDYRAEFDEILLDRRTPSSPTVYVCAQDRPGAPPGELDRVLVLVNAPALGDQGELDQEERARCARRALERLEICGLRLEPEGAPFTVTTPSDFHRRHPGSGGALYGPATHGWAAAFRRPGAATPARNLHLAGGAAHPGAGVPMAVLSGRIAARRVLRALDSTSPRRRAATPGGIWTPRVSTGARASP